MIVRVDQDCNIRSLMNNIGNDKSLRLVQSANQHLYVNRYQLERVLNKVRRYWFPQVDQNGKDIGLSDVNQRNIVQETPLIIAAQFLGPSDIEQLVEAGADVSAQAGLGARHSALHVARLMHRFDNANKLLELGADPTITNANGYTPLDYGRSADADIDVR